MTECERGSRASGLFYYGILLGVDGLGIFTTERRSQHDGSGSVSP